MLTSVKSVSGKQRCIFTRWLGSQNANSPPENGPRAVLTPHSQEVRLIRCPRHHWKPSAARRTVRRICLPPRAHSARHLPVKCAICPPFPVAPASFVPCHFRGHCPSDYLRPTATSHSQCVPQHRHRAAAPPLQQGCHVSLYSGPAAFCQRHGHDAADFRSPASEPLQFHPPHPRCTTTKVERSDAQAQSCLSVSPDQAHADESSCPAGTEVSLPPTAGAAASPIAGHEFPEHSQTVTCAAVCMITPANPLTSVWRNGWLGGNDLKTLPLMHKRCLPRT